MILLLQPDFFFSLSSPSLLFEHQSRRVSTVLEVSGVSGEIPAEHDEFTAMCCVPVSVFLRQSFLVDSSQTVAVTQRYPLQMRFELTSYSVFKD